MADGVSRSATRVRGFRNPEMDFQLMRSLGNGAYGAASPGECLALAARITDGDPESWVLAFAGLGTQLWEDGKARLTRGRTVSVV